MNLSACPFVCGWYSVVKTLCIPRILHTCKKKREANCEPLSVNTTFGVPKLYTHALQNAFATDNAVIVRSASVFVSLVNRSVITRMNRLPVFVLGRGPRMSMATYSRGLDGGNNFILYTFFCPLTRFLAHASQRSTHW